MTDDTNFAPWYVEGKALPLAHPIPWVYAEVYFPADETVEWRVYNYATDEYTVETFELVERETGTVPDEYRHD